jgi:hypothetical protein
MNKHLIWAWAIKNSIMLLAWTALAIVFNKWWIAFFAILFMNSFQTTHKSYRVCDACGKHSPGADNYNEALDKAKEAGWLHIVEGNKDYCPDCRKENDK